MEQQLNVSSEVEDIELVIQEILNTVEENKETTTNESK